MFLERSARGALAAGERPDRMLSVCFVAPHAWPVLSRDPHIQVVGGAEVQQAILARLLAANGYRVSMVCLDYGQPDRARIDGITVYKAFRPDAGLPVLRFVHPRLTSMWRAMRAAGADVYYYRSSSMWAGVVAQFCRRHGRRSIYAGASDRDFLPGGGDQMRFARDRWLYSRGLATVDRIVVQNPLQQQTCRENYGRDSLLVPSCYEPPAQCRQEEGDLALWVGTIQPHKRPELLLELAQRLPQRRFVMIGGRGSHPDFFNDLRSRAAAIPNLEFKGFLPLAQVEPWFDRARVLVSTSRYEGMPNVFLQAWARGVPTIATVDVGARLDGEPVYPVFSTVEEGASMVERSFGDPGWWRQASARCREYFARTHSPARVLAHYSSLLQELAA